MRRLTRDDLTTQHWMMRSDPQASLEMHNAFIKQHPADPHGYYARHQVLMVLGHKERALEDLNKAISIEPNATRLEDRGAVLRELGRHREALEDFNKAEALDPEGWKHSFGPLLRADCHAHLGNAEAAVADCAVLHDEYAVPGVFGFPPGGKQMLMAEIRRRAAAQKA